VRFIRCGFNIVRGPAAGTGVGRREGERVSQL